LLLDEIQIDSLTEDDKKFLDEFTQLELLSMNQTHLKSLKNFPDAKDLVRVSR
jgi:hypothetical protein